MPDQATRTSSSGALSAPLGEFLARAFVPLRWVVPGLVPAGGVVVLAGPPKTGKTTLAMDLAVAVAPGQAFLGRTTLAGPTLYVLEEGTAAGVADRFRRIVARRGTPADVHLALRAGIRTDDPPSWRALRAEIARLRPVLVVLDPLVKLHRADENSASEMAAVMARVLELSAEGTAVLAIHHTIKHLTEGGASVGASARGSGAITSSTDGNLILAREGDHLRLETEMRDAESETLRLDLDGATASFAVREAAATTPAGPRYPGGIDRPTVLALAAAALAADPAGGLTAPALAAARGCSDETARQALALHLADGVLEKAGPANRPLYRPAPATPTQAKAA